MLQLQPTMLPQGGASLPLAIAQYYCRQNLHLLEICRRTSLAVPAMRQFAAKRVLISRSRVFTSGQFKEQNMEQTRYKCQVLGMVGVRG